MSKTTVQEYRGSQDPDCSDPLNNRNTQGGATVIYSCRQSTATIEQIAELANLRRAFLAAKKGKGSRKGIREFELSVGANLLNLQNELLTGTYTPRKPRQFTIWCRSGHKYRLISSPRFRDSVVQHAIYQCIYYDFDRGFIFDSYGCRIGKGAHRGSERLMRWIRQSDPCSYYLQLDVRKFYYSIDHAVLRKSLERRIFDRRVVELIMLFVSADGVGLNVGSMLSQLLGLIYLDRLDHYIKRVLRVPRYIRYVDDFICVGLTRLECQELKNSIEAYLHTELRLTLSKAIIRRIRSGINFIGYRHFLHYKLVRKWSFKNFKRALKRGAVDSITACLAHARKCASYPHFINYWRHHQ